jgi:hypothetical protein
MTLRWISGLGGFAAGLCLMALGACASSGDSGPAVLAEGGVTGGGGGTTGGGGTSGTGGGGGSQGTGGAYDSSNLVNAEGWVGGDETTAEDNPMGIQGAFYVYGDNITCDCGNASGCTEVGNPCTSGKCCLIGATIVDNDYLSWGCGIGMELNSTGGDNPVKAEYTGPARCFDITLSGSSGGNNIRIGVTQLQDTTDMVSPFEQIAALDGTATATICLDDEDLKCPSWADAEECVDNETAYDIQIQVVGGEKDSGGTFEMCLTSIVPSE